MYLFSPIGSECFFRNRNGVTYINVNFKFSFYYHNLINIVNFQSYCRRSASFLERENVHLVPR